MLPIFDYEILSLPFSNIFGVDAFIFISDKDPKLLVVKAEFALVYEVLLDSYKILSLRRMIHKAGDQVESLDDDQDVCC